MAGIYGTSLCALLPRPKASWCLITVVALVTQGCDKKKDQTNGAAHPVEVKRSSIVESALKQEPKRKKPTGYLGLVKPEELVENGRLTKTGVETMRSIAGGFDSGELPDVWEFIKNLPIGEFQKGDFYRVAITHACVKEGGGEARKFLESLDTGIGRAYALSAFCKASKLSIKDLLEMEGGLKASDEKSAMRIGISGVVGDLSSLEGVKWAELGTLDSSQQKFLLDGLSYNAKTEIKDSPLAQEKLKAGLTVIDEMVANGQMTPEAAEAYLTRTSDVLPFDSWGALEARRDSFDPKQLGELERQLAVQMANKDPMRAMSRATASGVNPEAAWQVVQVWLKQDRNGAEEWIAGKWSSLSIPQADAAALAGLQHDLAANNSEGAAKWSALIRGDDARKKAATLSDGK